MSGGNKGTNNCDCSEIAAFYIIIGFAACAISSVFGYYIMYNITGNPYYYVFSMIIGLLILIYGVYKIIKECDKQHERE